MHQTVRGRVQRGHETRVGVAKRVHGDAADEIEVAFPLGVEEVHAFAAHHLTRRALVRVQHGAGCRHAIDRRHDGERLLRGGDAGNRSVAPRRRLEREIRSVSGHHFSVMH